MRNYISVE